MPCLELPAATTTTSVRPAFSRAWKMPEGLGGVVGGADALEILAVLGEPVGDELHRGVGVEGGGGRRGGGEGLDLGGIGGELGDRAKGAGEIGRSARGVLHVGNADGLGAGVLLAHLVGPGPGEEAELAEVVRTGPAEGVVQGRGVRQGVEHVEGDAGRLILRACWTAPLASRGMRRIMSGFSLMAWSISWSCTSLSQFGERALKFHLVGVGHLLGAEDAGRCPGVVAVDDHDDLLADGAVTGRLREVGRGDVPARPLHVVPVEGIGLGQSLFGIGRPRRHLAVVGRGRQQQLAVGGLQHARVDGE